MSELKIFENAAFGSVRVVEKDGEPWFVLRDVCKVLGLVNVGDVAARLGDDIGSTDVIDTLGSASNPVSIRSCCDGNTVNTGILRKK